MEPDLQRLAINKGQWKDHVKEQINSLRRRMDAIPKDKVLTPQEVETYRALKAEQRFYREKLTAVIKPLPLVKQYNKDLIKIENKGQQQEAPRLLTPEEFRYQDNISQEQLLIHSEVSDQQSQPSHLPYNVPHGLEQYETKRHYFPMPQLAEELRRQSDISLVPPLIHPATISQQRIPPQDSSIQLQPTRNDQKPKGKNQTKDRAKSSSTRPRKSPIIQEPEGIVHKQLGFKTKIEDLSTILPKKSLDKLMQIRRIYGIKGVPTKKNYCNTFYIYPRY